MTKKSRQRAKKRAAFALKRGHFKTRPSLRRRLFTQNTLANLNNFLCRLTLRTTRQKRGHFQQFCRLVGVKRPPVSPLRTPLTMPSISFCDSRSSIIVYIILFAWRRLPRYELHQKEKNTY